jgi:hypothetical protein
MWHTPDHQPWDHDKDLEDQDRFMTPDNCKLGGELHDLNDWKFVTLMPKPGEHEDNEINACVDDALQLIEVEMIPHIKFLNFGAYNCDEDRNDAPDGYYLVQWERGRHLYSRNPGRLKELMI